MHPQRPIGHGSSILENAVTPWLLNLYAVRLAMAPLLAFSPHGSSARLAAPYAIALCLFGLCLLRSGELSTMAGGSRRDT